MERNRVIRDMAMKGLGARSIEVLMRLRRDIDRGLFGPGDRLPTERELCDDLKVSRNALRRAVRVLADEGVLDVRHGSGMYVRKGAPSSPGSRLVSMMYEFEAENLAWVQNCLLSRGYLLCVYSQRSEHWAPDAERRFLKRVEQEGHRSLLAFCSPTEPRNDALLARLSASGVRVIHIEHYRRELPAEEYVLADYRKAGHMAAVELMVAGYERIVLTTVNPTAPHAQLISEGFVQALCEHGGGYDEARNRLHLHLVDRFEQTAKRLAALVTESGSVGFACDRAGGASRVAQVLRSSGFEIPEQVGVIAPEIIAEPPCGDVDTLAFDRKALLKRALDAATGPRNWTLRELVTPRRVPHGTVRGRCPRGIGSTS